MSLFEDITGEVKRNKDKVINGGMNSIPLPFTRFDEAMPGIERETYYQISANSKIGKSKITDFLFLYSPIYYAYRNPMKRIKIKIFYFTLELSKSVKGRELMAYCLDKFSNGNIRISSKHLKSVNANKLVPDYLLDFMQESEIKTFIQFFEERVTFIDDIKTPTGIYQYLKDYAEGRGHWEYIDEEFIDPISKEVTTRKRKDKFVEDDEDVFVIPIIDHMALISNDQGLDLYESITRLSSKYLVELRNIYKMSPVLIIQQMAGKESLESRKMNQLLPSSDGYGENKTVIRDCNIALGLFAPYRYGLPTYPEQGGYQIDKFKDYIRFLNVIVAREGGVGIVLPLYFDGCTNDFRELPLPSDQQLVHYINRISKLKSITENLYLSKTIQELATKNNAISTVNMIFTVVKKQSFIQKIKKLCRKFWY